MRSLLPLTFALVAALLISPGPVLAEGEEQAACGGNDMLVRMAQEDPALLERLRTEAAAVPHGTGLLWRIARDGVADSFLYGTMHMTDPRVTELPKNAQAAFDAAKTVVIETLEAGDPASMSALMLEKPELLMFTDSQSLTRLIKAEDRSVVEAAFAARGVPLGSLAKTKPWVVAAMIALPACEAARQAAGVDVLDLKLAADAKAAGKRLAGLERMDEQLEAMASLPMSFHMDGLVETARLGDRIADVYQTMIGIYRRGELGLFWPFFRVALPGGGGETYAAFQETMVAARNRLMAKRAEPILAGGGAFVAVGALHLPGEAGLVSLLSTAGYRLSPVE